MEVKLSLIPLEQKGFVVLARQIGWEGVNVLHMYNIDILVVIS